jgi:hypothetical protein
MHRFSKTSAAWIDRLGHSDDTPNVVQCTADIMPYITVRSPLHVQVYIIRNSFITGYP